MLTIGCDFHSRFQQIAMLDEQTGEIIERQLEHETGEARTFYAALTAPALVGMEAMGYAHWFQRMLTEQRHERWVGDAAEIRARMVRKQKTDRRDAAHLLRLLLENGFPRIWIPSSAERDLWQLLRHRFKLICMRSSVKNQLHALAMGQGVCRMKKLWAPAGRKELEALALDPWADRRRRELLEILDQLNPPIEELNQAIELEAEKCPHAVHLMKQTGVGPVTALAFVLSSDQWRDSIRASRQ